MGHRSIIVVGGGVVGLSVAAELLRRGFTVEVLDRGEPAGVSTAAAAGMLAPVSEAEIEEGEVLELALDSLHRFPAFVQRLEDLTGLDCQYRSDGTLWVALNRDDVGDLQHLKETVADRVSPRAARRLTAAEVAEREPHLSARVLEGLLVEADLQVDPRALLAALRRGVTELGGTVVSDHRVEEVEVASGRVRGVASVGPDGACSRPCNAVVLAAGAWSGATIRSPLPDTGIRPVKGQLVRLKGPPLLRHVVRHPEVYLVPRASGELLVGATMEEVGFDLSVTAGAVHDLLRHARGLLPGIYDLELSEISVGFRPVSRDNRPVIGASGVEGLFAACGHGRQGVLLAPATAHYLADCIESGTTPDEIRSFGVDRFARFEHAAIDARVARP